MMLVLYLVYPGPLVSVSFYRFIVSSSFYHIVIVLSYRHRFIAIVTDLPKQCRYGIFYRIVSKRYCRNVRYDIPPQTFIYSVFSTSFPLFSCPLFWLSLYSFCSAQFTPSTYKREFIVLCLQVLEMIPIRQLLNLALPPGGRESHFFPSNY